MATISWKMPVSDLFSVAADWSSGTVPGAADDAVLGTLTSAAYTVTANSSETVNSIRTAANATLAITGGTFTASSGSGGGVSAGTIAVGSGSTFSVAGMFDNAGVVSLTSYYGATMLISGATSLTGGGQIQLVDGSYATSNSLHGATAATTLTNVDNTISGAGQLGSGQLTLINGPSGIIDATGGSNQLVLNTGASVVTNTGLIEATGTAGLLIQSTTINNAPTGTTPPIGVILGNNSHVDLNSADIVGGFLKTQGTGSIQTIGYGSLLDGLSTHKVNVLGNVVVGNNGSGLNIQGGINLTQKVGTTVTNGSITLQSYYASELIVTAKSAAITGGQIIMAEGSYGSSNAIIGTLTGGKTPKVSKLTNNSTIVGAGSVGSNLTLINGSKGIINANGGSHALVIATGNSSVAGSNVVKNSGLIESTTLDPANGVGGLLISNTVISNSGATAVVQANGAATHVDLQTATIIGGTLKTLAGGVIQTIDRGSVLDGSVSVVNNQATIIIADSGTSLSLKGAINNTGAFSLTSYYNSQLIMAANTTLSGGGQVLMNDGSYGQSNQVYGATAATSLTNVNNTISGAGQLGAGQLTLINQAAGVIDATGSTNQLVINTAANAVSNAGLIEATGSAGLLITGSTIANTATGLITAGAGSHVDLATATISGGTLKASGSGYFQTVDRGSVLDGTAATLNNQATIDIAHSGTSLSLKGAINNTGAFSLTSYYNSQLIIAANTTLTGGGAVTLNEGAYGQSNQLYGVTTATTLTNVDNVISGVGQLGAAQLTLTNQAAGVIDATGTSNALVINTGSATVTNAGLIEATGSAGLSVSSAVANSGTLLANGGNVVVSGAITGAGTDSINGSSVFEAGAADSNTVSFAASSTGKLKLDQSQLFTGTVTGLSTGKTIDLANIAIGTATLTYTGTTTSGALQITDGSTTATIALTGKYTKANFHLADDGSGHVNVTYAGTGLGPTPGVAQMASAMAAMGGGGGGHSVVSTVFQTPTHSLVSLPHAA